MQSNDLVGVLHESFIIKQKGEALKVYVNICSSLRAIADDYETTVNATKNYYFFIKKNMKKKS